MQSFWGYERRSLRTRACPQSLRPKAISPPLNTHCKPGFHTPRPSGNKHHSPQNVSVSYIQYMSAASILALGCIPAMKHLPTMHKAPESTSNNNTEHSSQFQVAQILSFQIKQGLDSFINVLNIFLFLRMRCYVRQCQKQGKGLEADQRKGRMLHPPCYQSTNANKMLRATGIYP